MTQTLARLGAAAILFALFVFPAFAAPWQAKTKLELKAEPGRTVQTRSTIDLQIEAMGQKVAVEIKQTQRADYKSVAANGDITIESKTESQEMRVNGQTMPSPEEDDVSTVVVSRRGILVSYTSSADEEEQQELSTRLFAALHPVFSDQPVGPGDKWTHDFVANSSLRTRAARGEYTLVAYEKLNGIDVARLDMAYAETEGSPALNSKGTFWVSVASGDIVRSNFEINNVPFGGPGDQVLASGKGEEERISGSPIAEGGSGSQSQPAADKKEKTIDETVKDYEKIPGLFTLYRKQESGRDTIMMEIAESQLDRLVMLQATASTGDSERVVAGDPISDVLFKFVRQGDRLLLVVPNFAFRADQNRPLDRSVRRSFAESFLESLKIEARQEDRKSLLINVSDLFRGDIAQVASLFQGGQLPIPGLAGGPSYSLDREKTFVEQIKNFPENVVVRTTYNFQRPGAGRSLLDLLGVSATPDPRSIAFRVNYNIFMLPEGGYRPRLADGRVGYFTADYQNVGADKKLNQNVRQILRWRLEKKDPTAPISEPKKPITFWMDNAIPTEYREAVKGGILVWNRAFERIGFKDAIVVKQMPDDADFDHADMRFNVIRWVSSANAGYAVALFRPNPITGEILNASITVDANMVRYVMAEKDFLVDPASRIHRSKAADEHAHRHVNGVCDYGERATAPARFGYLAATAFADPATAEQVSKDYLQQFIFHVVSHEMGHILGLRHNFISSTESTMEQLKNPERVAKLGTAASVMEYTPTNLSALGQKGVYFWAPVIGTYDYWAIEYGYLPIDAPTPEAELPRLRQIASKANSPGLAYQSDEVADGFDPLVTRFDLSARPMEYWKTELEVADRLMRSLGDRVPKRGESYWEFTRQFNFLLGQMAGAGSQLARYVGALHLNANYRGDAGEKPTLMPANAADQRTALQMVIKYVLAEGAFPIPKQYLVRFATNPDGSFVESFLGGQNSFPIRDSISRIQTGVLEQLMDPEVLGRVANNEYKVVGQLTLVEMFRTLGDAIWSEVGTARPITELRRQLQRKHIDLLTAVFVRPEAAFHDDAKMLAWHELRRLRNRIQNAKIRATDAYTPIHLEESLMRVARALEARQTIGGERPRSRNLLEQLLGGSEPKKR